MGNILSGLISSDPSLRRSGLFEERKRGSNVASNSSQMSVRSRSGSTTTALRWVHCSGEDPPPPGAISGGVDPDGDRLYVGRAYHAGCQLPAKVVPCKEYAYVTNAGQVVRKKFFEVLCGGSVSWVRPENSSVIPPRAVVGGLTSTGEVLYIGRGYSPDNQMMGKIVPREQTLYIAYEGWEYSTKHYEFLVES